jgi:hypothetical protein
MNVYLNGSAGASGLAFAELAESAFAESAWAHAAAGRRSAASTIVGVRMFLAYLPDILPRKSGYHLLLDIPVVRTYNPP